MGQPASWFARAMSPAGRAPSSRKQEASVVTMAHSDEKEANLFSTRETGGLLLPLSLPFSTKPPSRAHGLRVAFVALLAFTFAASLSTLAWSSGPSSPPYQPDGRDVEDMVPAFPAGLQPDAVRAELAGRLRTLGKHDLRCDALAFDPSRYEALGEQKTLFALNLYNNEDVLPTLADSLLRTIEQLGGDNVAVSIFENGSTDRTPVGLAHLAAALSSAGVQHRILSDPTKTRWKEVDRLEQLAVYRNVVLEPLTPESGFDTVLFINDVFFCARDALELLYQRTFQDATAACGLDFVAKGQSVVPIRNGAVTFYDDWVIRSLSGRTIRPRFDFFRNLRSALGELFAGPGEEEYKWRFDAGLPTPVYSCWNGAIALDATPFKEGVRFRAARDDECRASECSVLAKDLWRGGFDRFVLVPGVRTTYDAALYNDPQLVEMADTSLNSVADADLAPFERIDWEAAQRPESIECYPWRPFTHVDFWWTAIWESPV